MNFPLFIEEEKKKERKEKKKPVSKIRDISEMDDFDQDYVPGMQDANGDLPGVETTVAAKRVIIPDIKR